MISGQKVSRTVLFGLAVAALTLGLAACGDDDSSDSGAGCAQAEGGTATVVAKDIKFDPTCVEIPSDTDVDIVLDNQDDGVQHNIHIKGAPDDPTTELEAGVVEQTLSVNLPAGSYDYVCDLHPAMTGTLTAGPPPAGN